MAALHGIGADCRRSMRTYFWDFGDDRHGEGSAQQYLLLLNDFLQDHRLRCETGILMRPNSGFSTWCKAPPEARALIEKTLGPVRFSDSES